MDADDMSYALRRVKEAEPEWRRQVSHALGRPVEFHVDFDSLRGRFDHLQPFVHQSVRGAIEAIEKVGLGPDVEARDKLRAAVRRVVVRAPRAGEQSIIHLDAGTLTIRPWLHDANEPRADEVAAAILERLKSEPVPAPPLSAEGDSDSSMPGRPSRRAIDRAAAYAQAEEHMQKLERVMREHNAWPGDPPPGPVEVRGAFGSENMAFEQWLAWVLIPRVREIITQRGEFPKQSQTSTYSRRNLDGMPYGDDVTMALYDFDAFIESIA